MSCSWQSSSHIYRPQRRWAKVMFLQASVILSTGGSTSVHAGMPSLDQAPPPQEQTPPRPRPRPRPREQTPRADPPEQTPPEQTPPDQTPQPPQSRHPLGSRHPPRADTPRGGRRQHMVNERPVRILLECILVDLCYTGWARLIRTSI